jgi:methionine-gamma-lyase
MHNKEVKKETALIHKGYVSKNHHDSLTIPLYQTSTFAFSSAEEGERRFAGEESGNIYSRLGNPTVSLLEERMMELESGNGALAFGSGIRSKAVLRINKTGDIKCSRGIYGCIGLLKCLKRNSIFHIVFTRWKLKKKSKQPFDQIQHACILKHRLIQQWK